MFKTYNGIVELLSYVNESLLAYILFSLFETLSRYRNLADYHVDVHVWLSAEVSRR